MKFFKLFKWYELTFFGLMCATVIALGIVFHSPWFIIINSLLGITTSFLVSKGIYVGLFLGIIQAALYMYLSFLNAFYGEMIVCGLFSIPSYVVSTVTWKRNRDKGQVKVNKSIGLEESLIAVSVSFALAFGIYYMLRAFNTANLLISTFAASIGLLKGYLQIRRSEYNFIFSCLSRCMVFTLWFTLVLNGGLSYIPTMTNYIVYFLIEIFGFFEWIRLKRKQAAERKALECSEIKQ